MILRQAEPEPGPSDVLQGLRAHNRPCRADRQVGDCGVDHYRLFTSMRVVLNCLAKVDPEAATRARSRCACADQAAEDAQAQWLRRRASGPDRHEALHAQQNARLVRNAEVYCRLMF